jgi:phosphatidylglycerol:prolipoprotein diacylglycerol transferase
LYGLLVGVFCLAVSLILWSETYRTKRFATGTTFFGFIITYSLVRSVIEEPFRNVPLPWKVVDPATAGYGLFTTTQLASIVLIIIAVWGLTQVRKWERNRSLAPAPPPPPVKPEGKSRQVQRAVLREKQKGK